jgi:hypothetical protein
MAALHTLGRYRLLRCIGVGGMAEVYEARRTDDPTGDARLALKVLLPQHVDEIDIVKSFIDEATIAASLSHPNVVAVVDYGCVDEHYFIAMEHLHGWDLHELIGSCSVLKRPMPVPAAAYLIHELAQALDYIHTRPFEIVHRDVTPHNVFVDRKGRVKLSDFGVAKTAVRWSQTHTGLIKGKLAYLAPEQLRGEPVTNRTDIYSAGLVLFELLTCERYNRSSTQSGLLSRAHDPAVQLPSELNPAAAPLDEVIRGALQHDPAMRTRDAALLAEQTQRVLARTPFRAADMARVAERLQREARSVAAAEAEQTIPERLRPEAIEGVASGELVLEQTERTLRTGGPALAPEAIPGDPASDELEVQETARTGGPERLLLDGLRSLGPSEAEPTPEPITFEPGAAAETGLSGLTTLPGDPESGLIRLIREPPAGQPLQISPTGTGDLPLPGGHLPKRRTRWVWLVFIIGLAVGVLAIAALLLVRRAAPPQAPRRPAAAAPALDATARPASQPVASSGDATAADARGPDGAPSGEEQLVRLTETARQQGLWPGDLPEFDRLRGEAQWAVRRQRSSAWELQQLARFVARFRIDAPFVRAKLRRLERAIARRGKREIARRRDATRQLRRLIEEGQLVEASRQISLLAKELRNP